ncbi:hypothetical protein ASG43_03215 [Aureimonas sp. Leaf454]|uniref:hypothetical protein n=1 Tax=Aureimonas sp. Leaf454 TaxID=1736381 RepID=UPI0006FBF5BA|nr:hypothetical protein [Aureimonas sp. Leaf454]KQT54609.1 hypothetical protein ASG43_03215 [Aureimonas sp. Leaf454]
MSFVLKKDGAEIARHSTRLACVVEAIERKLAVRWRRGMCLVGDVHIEEDRSREVRPLSEAPRKQERRA